MLFLLLSALMAEAKNAVLYPVNPPIAATPATLSNYVDASIYKKLLLLREVEKLNDIMLYEYVQEYVKSKSDDTYVQQLLNGYIMGELGYDIVIAGNESDLGVYAHSTDDLFERDYITKENKRYYYISSTSKNIENAKTLAFINGLKKGSTQFCFSCSELPSYAGYTPIKKTLEFAHNNKKYKYTLTSGKEVLNMYYKQPNLGLSNLFTDNYTAEASEQLVALIKNDVKKMNTREGLAFILSFTRTAFAYKSDLDRGYELYLNPEQTIFAENSDCEDRAALAFYLIRRVYDLPIAVVMFQSHIGLAVKDDTITGDIINHDGFTYSYLEATGPGNVLKPGEMPEKYKGQSYSIISVYIP